MIGNKKYIWTIIIVAFCITLLANLELINRFYELTNSKELSAIDSEQYYFILRVGFVGVITDLMILVLV